MSKSTQIVPYNPKHVGSDVLSSCLGVVAGLVSAAGCHLALEHSSFQSYANLLWPASLEFVAVVFAISSTLKRQLAPPALFFCSLATSCMLYCPDQLTAIADPCVQYAAAGVAASLMLLSCVAMLNLQKNWAFVAILALTAQVMAIYVFACRHDINFADFRTETSEAPLPPVDSESSTPFADLEAIRRMWNMNAVAVESLAETYHAVVDAIASLWT